MSLRVCDLCGGIDDTARHVISHGPGEAPVVPQSVFSALLANTGVTDADKVTAIGVLTDQSIEMRHVPCCAQAGCPSGSCTSN